MAANHTLQRGVTAVLSLIAVLALVQSVVPDPVTYATTYLTAFAATAFLGAAKKWTNVADTTIFKVIKPVQPWLVLGMAMLLPRLIHGTPNVPDPGQLIAAPTATLLAVGAAEIIRRFFPLKGR